MNTVTLGVRPAKAPCAFWTQDPRALKLLASCAKNPPKGGYVHGGFALHREQDCCLLAALTADIRRLAGEA